MGIIYGGKLRYPVHAVLFDMDGLLLDSERLAVESDMETLLELEYPANRELLLAMLGETDGASNQILAAAFPRLNLDEFWRKTHARFYERILQGDLEVKPGAVSLIHWLQQHGIPYALASSSGRTRILDSLTATGLKDDFPVIVSGDDGVRSKPEPDIFLLASRLLHCAPMNCLVLEDSPNGLRAARRGGMQVVMVPDLIPWNEEWIELTDHVCTSLQDVTELLS